MKITVGVPYEDHEFFQANSKTMHALPVTW